MYKRFYRHRSELRANIHRNSYLQRAFNKVEERDFLFYRILTCQRHELSFHEEKWIKNPPASGGIYNLKTSSFGRPGDTFTQETKDKMSASMKRYWANPENRARASASRIGRKNSPEHIAKTVAGCSMRYDLMSPSGERHVGINRAEFCRKMGLRAPGVVKLTKGLTPAYRGWRLFSPMESASLIRPRYKLTPQIVSDIRAMKTNTGLSNIKISKIFNVCAQSIDQIIARKTWRNVP